MVMSHLPSLVAITHVRSASTAAPASVSGVHHYHLPLVIIAERMFSSRGTFKRKHPLSSLSTPSSATSSKLALAPETPSAETSQAAPKLRRIVRRNLYMDASDANAPAVPPTQVDGNIMAADSPDGDTNSAATDDDDDVTLVGADLLNWGTLWPKALVNATMNMKEEEGKSKDAEHQLQYTLSRKILQHISDSDSEFSDDSHPNSNPNPNPDHKTATTNASDDELNSQIADSDEPETSDPPSPASMVSQPAHYHYSLRNMPYDPEFEIEVEERTIVHFTQLTPPPWHRLRRAKDALAFEQVLPAGSSH